MAKIQPVWAIDVGQSALKALKLVPGEEADKLLAEAFDFIEYPKILSQPDADPEELIREALATFLGRNEVVGCKVALGVSGQAGLVKFIKLPPVEKKRIPDIVKFEARQQIPFALDEVIWDYQQIGGGDDGDDDSGFTMAEVGLFAMKRDQITRAILPLKVAGIEVDIVQMGPISLYNFAAYDRKKPEGDATSVVYLDIGADNTDLIITDGDRIWQRNVPIGGNHFTRALTKELKLTFAKAEHLKRNATKAPDPRAVFTAMRGVFNDFSSEVNRSIGFYSSVNRTAKIAKVVGLGNGFKLPGLQKFLQQNLSYDVEKLESFDRLVGDEVVTAPQFIENLPSFAVAYGLAIQGIGSGPLKTNLLPPEIEQVRMIRRKKPWALAASALFMFAFSILFFSDYGAFARVNSGEFKTAVDAAKAQTNTGQTLQANFDKSKQGFDAKKKEGDNLVSGSLDPTSWPALVQVVSKSMPDPAAEASIALKETIDPTDPKNFDLLSQLRVHIDAIVPRWREDVSAGWFSDSGWITPPAKVSMHPLDREEVPKGSGWIVQVVAHHYNPSPLNQKLTPEEKKIAIGPTAYIQHRILRRLWQPDMRAFGIHHACLTWLPAPDRKWTTSKDANPSLLAPFLKKDVGKGASSEVATGGDMSGGGRLGSEAFGGGGGGGMSAGRMPGMGGGMGGGMGMDRMMEMMGGGRMGMGGGGESAAKDAALKTLTRTDFKIEFIWQPPNPTDKPLDEAEMMKKLVAAEQKNQGAVSALDEAALAKASEAKSAEKFSEAQRAAGGGNAGQPASGVAPPGNPPGGPPAGATPKP